MTSPHDVAVWMLQQLQQHQLLYQNVAAEEIAGRFGGEFVYTNENGNLAISRKVLSEFRKLTADDVVWERGERMWRFREAYDGRGRQAE